MQWEEEGARITQPSLVQIKIRSEMTITMCSGLIVFPPKPSVLQIGEINCFKSQVDSLWQGSSACSWTGPPPLQHPSGQPPSHRLLSSGVLRQAETEGLWAWVGGGDSTGREAELGSSWSEVQLFRSSSESCQEGAL